MSQCLPPIRRVIVIALLAFSSAGCVSSFELHPESPVPKRWASDPRFKGLGPLRIVYSGGGERVTADVTSRGSGRHYSARGTWRWEASPDGVGHTPAAKRVQIYEFDGMAERYKTVYVRKPNETYDEAYLWLLPETRRTPK